MDQKLFDDCFKKYHKQIPDTWEDLAKKHGLPNGEYLRVLYKNFRKKENVPSEYPKQQVSVGGETMEYRESVEIRGNGDVISDRLIEICEEDSKSPQNLGLYPMQQVLNPTKTSMNFSKRKQSL